MIFHDLVDDFHLFPDLAAKLGVFRRNGLRQRDPGSHLGLLGLVGRKGVVGQVRIHSAARFPARPPPASPRVLRASLYSFEFHVYPRRFEYLAIWSMASMASVKFPALMALWRA